MQQKIDWPIWHWHIENSSICSLKCPRCPRNEIPESLVQTSLGLNFFKKNFDSNFLQNVWQISFCGDDGDPIYGKEFLEIVQYLKNMKPNLSLRIITNGSHRNQDWWKKLSLSLNEYDDIHFSIDGWNQESNEKYRVNCDWKSIETAIKTLRNNCEVIMTWAMIVFNFNEKQIQTIKNLAIDWKFDLFQITHSTKFGCNYKVYNNDGIDLYEPSKEFISQNHRFNRKIIKLTNKDFKNTEKNVINKYYYDNLNKDSEIIPLCKIGNKGLYISSDGYFYPCCWMANRYNHTRWNHFKQDIFDLKNRSINEVLSDEYWTNFYKDLFSNAECSNKCSSKNFNLDYATSW